MSSVVSLGKSIREAELEAQVAELKEKLKAMREAKDGFKKMATQAIADMKYVKTAVAMTYAERRVGELQKEFAAIKDEA